MSQTQQQNPNNRVIIFDTTLRDGEQSPGCSMNLDEKLRIAHLLDEMGVDVIEAGFPIASQGDWEAVNEISKVLNNAVVCGLSRATKKDIEASASALEPAKQKRIHTFISTSPLHMKYKLQMSPENVMEKIAESVTSAQITMLKNRVPNIDKAILSVHCHNDLGLAVANSLAGIQAGARQIECTINGIGERAGNAALEEIVMAIRTRNDKAPFHNNIKTEMLTKASKTLSTTVGFNVQPNKAIVGANAFAHESGIHQDGMLKNAQTYEIMTPESVGLTKSELVLGKHSGRHALSDKLKELGYDIGDNAFQDFFKRFKDLADRKKEIFDEDIIALIDDELGRDHDKIKFKSLQIVAGTTGPQTADLCLDFDGEEKCTKVEGNGPVDAIFRAIRDIVPHENAHLQLYQVHAVTGGTDAQAGVTVRLEEDGKTVTGQGSDSDTLVASARAYVHALNKLMTKREKSKPQD